MEKEKFCAKGSVAEMKVAVRLQFFFITSGSVLVEAVVSPDQA